NYLGPDEANSGSAWPIPHGRLQPIDSSQPDQVDSCGADSPVAKRRLSGYAGTLLNDSTPHYLANRGGTLQLLLAIVVGISTGRMFDDRRRKVEASLLSKLKTKFIGLKCLKDLYHLDDDFKKAYELCANSANRGFFKNDRFLFKEKRLYV
ncbi:hypothetical protein CR513_10315, partial [Mucuna pruriens]